MSSVIDCPKGSYCLAGSSNYTQCPIGTYLDQTNGKAFTDCKACPGGKYCATLGLANWTGDCDAGYFCTKNAKVKNPTLLAGSHGPCLAGYYCPAGSSYGIKCPPGTYNSGTGKTVAS